MSPQQLDPNYRANPIDALNLAVANLHAEREKLRTLIADYRRFVAGFELPITAIDYEFRMALNITPLQRVIEAVKEHEDAEVQERIRKERKQELLSHVRDALDDARVGRTGKPLDRIADRLMRAIHEYMQS